MPMLIVASIASGYLACSDESIDPTPAPEDGGLDVQPPKDDGAALDAQGNNDGSSATDGNTGTDSNTTDAPEDAPIDGPDDSPSSNG